MADIEDIIQSALSAFKKKDLRGKKVVITAGPTIEYIDPIRIISNRSSGKMGIELAKEAQMRGAEVTLIFGPGTAKPPSDLRVLKVETVSDMLGAVKQEIKDTGIFISAAAISDFTVDKSPKKISTREGEKTLTLKPTPKILKEIRNEKAFKVGFKALSRVSENELLMAGKQIMAESDLDLVVANDVSEGVFGSDKNHVYIISAEGLQEQVPYSMKSNVSEKIFDQIVKIIN